MELERLKRLTHSQVKNIVLRALRSQDSGGCHQANLLKLICSVAEVNSLRGQPRKDFEAKVNKAVGALLREGKPKITKPNNGDWIRLARKTRK